MSTSYRNPQIPEGINVSHEHPLKEFVAMAIGLGLSIVALIVVLALLANWMVRFIPFNVEKDLMTSMNIFTSSNVETDNIETANNNQKIERYLQQLATELISVDALPEGMTITVHYNPEDTVNAYATLGGHVVIYGGLLEKIEHENTLAMVLAHEIAHIKHRDPITSLGRGVTVGLALACLTGFGDSGFSQQLVAHVGTLSALSFSRDQEKAADATALKLLLSHYGHAQGAEELFALFEALHKNTYTPEFFSTHPLDSKRINAVKLFNQQHSPSDHIELKKLPDFILATQQENLP